MLIAIWLLIVVSTVFSTAVIWQSFRGRWEAWQIKGELFFNTLGYIQPRGMDDYNSGYGFSWGFEIFGQSFEIDYFPGTAPEFWWSDSRFYKDLGIGWFAFTYYINKQ